MNIVQSQLLAAARCGVPEAFEVLLLRHSATVFFFSLLKIGDDLLLARAVSDLAFREFFQMLLNGRKVAQDSRTLLALSASLCAKIRHQQMQPRLWHYPGQHGDRKTWEMLKLVRQLPENYQLPLLLYLWQASPQPAPPDYQMLAQKGEAMLNQEIGPTLVQEYRNHLRRVHDCREFAAWFLQEWQARTTWCEHFFQFFIGFVTYTLLAVTSVYFLITIQFSPTRSILQPIVATIYFLQLLSLAVIKIIAVGQRWHGRAKWREIQTLIAS